MKLKYLLMAAITTVTVASGTAPTMAQEGPGPEVMPFDGDGPPVDVFIVEDPVPMSEAGMVEAAGGMCPIGGRGGCGFLGGLTLSDEQSEKLYSLKKDSMAKSAPKMADLKVAQCDLFDLMSQPEIDKTKVQSLQNRINGLRSDLANLRTNSMIDGLNVLTAEQRRELRRSFLKRATMPGDCGRGRMFSKRMHHGGGGGKPGCP